MLTCICGFRGYAGYLREYEYLTQRRQWLADRIAEQAPPPDTVTAQAYGIWPAGTPAQPSAAPPRKGSAQTLLVTLGAGLLILAGLVFVAVAWELFGPFGQLAILAGSALVTALAAIRLRTRVPRTAEALAVVAFALGLIVAGAGPGLGALPERWGNIDSLYSLFVCAVAVAFGTGMGHRFGITSWLWLGWLSTLVLLASAMGIVTDPLQAELTSTLSGIAYLALASGLVAFPLQTGRLPVRVTASLSLIVAAGLTVSLLDYDPPTGAVVVVSVALLAVLLLQDTLGHRASTWIGWPLFGFWLALLLLLAPTSTAMTAVVAVAGTALLFLLARWGIALAAVAVGVLWSVWLIGAAPPDARWFFGVAGVGLFAFSLRKGAAPLAWFAALLVQTAFLLQIDEVPFFEVPTLVLAGLLLLAGLIQFRSGERRSLILYAPALSAALLPSALMVWDESWSTPSLARFLLVMLGGVVCLLLGVRAHLLGLVVPATLAVSIAATAQLWATLDTLPRWLALALAGAALIGAGARIEWVREKRQETSAWLRTLQ